LKRLENNKTSFGRHQTFPIRFSWPTKGFRHWCEGHDVYSQDEDTVSLGVGKNMVASIRYWLTACNLVENKSNSIKATEFGSTLLSPTNGFDQYLEDETTIWLLHWKIASNAKDATSFYWFFNHFHKGAFSSEDVEAALKQYLNHKLNLSVADKTIESDVAVLLRMYGPGNTSKKIPIEEMLQSPMTELRLVGLSSDQKHFNARSMIRHNLPIAAFGYAVIELLELLKESSISIKRLHVSEEQYAAPGSVFRLSEEGLLAKLEELQQWLPDVFEVRETAGIHQLFKLGQITKTELMAEYYLNKINLGAPQ
jgi:hypothetical protein